MSVALLLAPNWPGTFRRSIFDATGTRIRTIEFRKAEPVVLSDDEFIALSDDVGKAVVYPATNDAGQPISKPAKDQGEEVIPKRKKK